MVQPRIVEEVPERSGESRLRIGGSEHHPVEPREDETPKKDGIRKKVKRVARDAVIRRTSTKG